MRLHTRGLTLGCVVPLSCYNDEWLFLAPHNLKKLKLFLSQERNASFVLDRYKRLHSMWWEAFGEGHDEKKALRLAQSEGGALGDMGGKQAVRCNTVADAAA